MFYLTYENLGSDNPKNWEKLTCTDLYIWEYGGSYHIVFRLCCFGCSAPSLYVQSATATQGANVKIFKNNGLLVFFKANMKTIIFFDVNFDLAKSVQPNEDPLYGIKNRRHLPPVSW